MSFGTSDHSLMGTDMRGFVVTADSSSQAMNAQRRGAIGVLIYTDPADDGYARGDTYPDGPWRPAFGVQVRQKVIRESNVLWPAMLDWGFAPGRVSA